MPEFVRGQPRRKPSKSKRFYSQWGEAHNFCAACGREDGGVFGLSSHHIVKQGRAHEACNLLRLCISPCHDLAEGMTIRGEGEPCVGFPEIRKNMLLPKITLGIALSLKLRCDPDEVDWDRLQELRGSKLPELEPIPTYFVDLWKRNRLEAESCK